MAETQHSDRNENSFIIKQVSWHEAILCSSNKKIGGSCDLVFVREKDFLQEGRAPGLNIIDRRKG